MLDRDFNVVVANPAFEATYGLTPEQVVGRPLREVGAGQWDIPELRRLLERVLPERHEVRDMEVRADFRGMGTRFMRLNARQVRLGGEGTELILLSLSDVTNERAYEERIEQYARHLERSNRDLESFAHAASHDLQEPLRKILMYVDGLTRVIDEESLDDRARRYLERLPQAVQRLQTRITDLLQLARIGRTEPERRPTDLNEVVAAVLDDLEVRLSESDAAVEVAELPVVEVDPSQMRLLFQNLVANGLKFHKDGVAPRVRVHSRRVEGRDAARSAWEIVVEDDGIGFDQEYAERVFEPFQRLHGRSQYEGSGVGLAICRKIAEEHDGSITAEGRAGRGARFTLLLPDPWPEASEQ